MSGFKYFFPCPKHELTVDGQMELLDLDVLGDARVAMQDCLKIGHQCMLSDLGVHCQFGPGAMLDPFPVEGERPSFGEPRNEDGWAWLDFPWKGDRVARIGFRPSDPPAPEHLRRREQITGYMIDDSHGRQWRMPTARDRSSQYGNLPTFIIPEADDRWTRQLDSRYSWLWELAGEVWEALECFYKRGKRPEYAFPWFPRQISRVIGLNYRIGPLELRAFAAMNRSFLTDDFCIKAGEALVDWQAMESYLRSRDGDDQKKTADKPQQNSLATTGVMGDAGTSPALANSG